MNKTARGFNMEKIKQFIKEHDNYIIYTHTSPDGDAIGSSYALYHALKQLGKKAAVFFGDDISEKYSYLNGKYVKKSTNFENVICVDCGDSGRISSDISVSADINIDHHKTNDNYGRFNLVDADACASGIIVYKIINELGVKLTKDIASCLYTAIATDTGRFMYANTTREVYETVAVLYDTGIDIAKINKILFDTYSLESLKARAFCLNNLKSYLNGRLSVTYIPYEKIVEYRLTDIDLDALSSISRSVEGTVVGVFIKERVKDVLRVSLRSSGNVDVSKIATAYGGGGHLNASGLTYNGKIDDFIKEFIKKAEEEYVNEWDT